MKVLTKIEDTRADVLFDVIAVLPDDTKEMRKALSNLGLNERQLTGLIDNGACDACQGFVEYVIKDIEDWR